MRKIKIKTEEGKKIDVLEQENSDLLFQNAMQDMSIQSLQDENSELMLKVAMLEMGGI